MERRRLDAFVDLTESLRKILLAFDTAANSFVDNYPLESDEDGLTRDEIYLMLSELLEQFEYSIHEIDYVISEADSEGIISTIRKILNRE